MDPVKLEKLKSYPFFERFRKDRDFVRLEKELRSFRGEEDLDMGESEIGEVLNKLRMEYAPGKSVLESMRNINSFRFPRMDSFPYPAVFLSRKVISDVQYIGLNLRRILNPPFEDDTADMLGFIDRLVRNRFGFDRDPDPVNNLSLLADWIGRKLLLEDIKGLKKDIVDHVRDKYSDAIAEELANVKHNTNVDMIIKDAQWRAENISAEMIPPKQGIFDLAFLKVIYARLAPHDKGEAPSDLKDHLLSARKEYSERKRSFNVRAGWYFFGGRKKNRIEVWNYRLTVSTLDTVVAATKLLHERFAGYDIVFLARDGLIFYEAYLKMFPKEKKRLHLYYISRQTLNRGKIHSEYTEQQISEELFREMKEDILVPAIEKHGLGDIEAVIRECTARWSEVLGRTPEGSDADKGRVMLMKEVATEIVRYLEPCLKSDRVVFFDSSSKTFPVVLSGLCRMFYPRKDIRAFFAVTGFKDKEAGYLTGKKESFVTDYIADMVKYNAALSSVVPYKAEMKLSTPEMQGTSFLCRIMLYQRIGVGDAKMKRAA